MSDNKDLILHSARLARRAPEEWQHFLGALAKYVEAQRTHCIASPLDILPVAQGRAQACTALLALFADCLSSADKIEGKYK